MKKVGVTSSSFSKNSQLRMELLNHVIDVEFNETGQPLNEDAVIRLLTDKDAAIVGLEKINEHVLKQCPKLKRIAKYGVGLDNIDQDACATSGVEVGWKGGVNKRSVSEMTLAFMISLSRNLYQSSLSLKQGKWIKNGGRQLSEKTIGIIGVGQIGKDIIQLLAPFNCKILGNDIIQQTEYYKANGVIESTQDKILQSADIISVHTPLTQTTRNMLNARFFEKMKTDSMIINTARGGILNQEDLKKALMNQTIAGAAIDVYEEEPPTDMELLSLPNLWCTPHIGGNAAEAILAMGRSAIDHIKQ